MLGEPDTYEAANPGEPEPVPRGPGRGTERVRTSAATPTPGGGGGGGGGGDRHVRVHVLVEQPPPLARRLAPPRAARARPAALREAPPRGAPPQPGPHRSRAARGVEPLPTKGGVSRSLAALGRSAMGGCCSDEPALAALLPSFYCCGRRGGGMD
eukprot:gene739-biopygen458